jgi:tetratricopeptide (TPR) repeat protein
MPSSSGLCLHYLRAWPLYSRRCLIHTHATLPPTSYDLRVPDLADCGCSGLLFLLAEENRRPGVSIPVVRALIELEGNAPEKAVAALQAATPYELGTAQGLLPIYIRGQAYLRAKRGAEAAAEFQKIVDHRGIAPTLTEHSLAKLGLGRAYRITGDTAKARAAYQDFFALWKDADPDIPILKEAKAEYAKLQ